MLSPTLSDMLEPLADAIDRAKAMSQRISPDRQRFLRESAEAIRDAGIANRAIDLVFVCTHNSRRSHLAQVWMQVALADKGINQMQTYSCGTEATSCNERTIRSLRRSGFSVVQTSKGDNPHYLLQYSETRPPLELYSKVFQDASLPKTDFFAMMCCEDVDQSCPFVPGALSRIPLHYLDPKRSDGTIEESATYDARSMEIASEMFALVEFMSNG